ATVSTTFGEPYHVARAISTIDHISGGRAAWNVVTSSIPAVSANFGRDLPEHDLRYEIANEFVDVVRGLWDSWDDDAVVADPATGVYVDPAKIHEINHKGRFYS